MISWPLFKQSVKANFVRWLIVTLASCFIVATVIIILGNLDISEIKTSLEGLFEDSDKQAEIQGEAIDSYKNLKSVYDEVLTNYSSKVDLVNRAIDGTAEEAEYSELGDDFVNAINQIKSGENQVTSGEAELTSAESKLTSSKQTYNSSKATYQSQLNTLNSQKKQVEDGIAQCDSGLSQIQAGLDQLASYESQFQQYSSQFDSAQSNLDKVNDGLKQVEDGLSKVNDGIKALDAQIASLQTDEEKQALKSSEQYQTLVTQKTTLETQKSGLETQAKQLQDLLKLKEAYSKKQELEAKKSETEATKADLQSKLTQITDGINKINSGLASGQSQITAAENKISSSKNELDSATKQIASSKEELRTSAVQSIKDKILEEVKNKSLEQNNDEETAEKIQNEASKIIDKYVKGEDTSEDAKVKMAQDFLSQEIYDEAIKDDYSDKEAKLAKTIATSAISSYNSRISNGETEETARQDTTKSLIEELPKDVADAITEIKDMNVYGLVVGNILFRIAGLLLPMIFVIMTANSLISGQVDSGSMAYILSTPIKRKKVAFTQMVYLICSIFLMYALIVVTGVVSINFAHNSDFTLTRENIVLFGLGAVMVIFAISGICYLASSIFDREKNSLSVGGGISMFFLVCSILGIFGEKVIPSIIRIDAMNYFNYASIITLFDVQSMIDGTNAWHSGLVYLFLIGIICYIIGINKFDKKDLPL